MNDRVIPSHWEGGLIKGPSNAFAVGTLAKRMSLVVTLAKMADGGAPAAVDGYSAVLDRIDDRRRLSMTDV